MFKASLAYTELVDALAELQPIPEHRSTSKTKVIAALVTSTACHFIVGLTVSQSEELQRGN